MDAFDFTEPTPKRPRRKLPLPMWDILAILLLIGTLFIAFVFLSIFINPQSGMNPFPPPARLTQVIFPTVTDTPQITLPPTWTPVPSKTPTQTDTPVPSSTPFPTVTPFGMPSATVTPTPVGGGMSFVVKPDSVRAIENIYDLNEGCNWMGVSGQAEDMSGAPVLGLIVQFGGTLEGVPKEGLYMTGTASQFGKGGFVIPISDHPVASNGTLWIQLMDQQNIPLSEKIYFDTFNDCKKNLIIIYFNQVK